MGFFKQEVIDKGNKAKVVFDTPIVQEAFDDVKLAIHSAWSECGDETTRQELWHQLQALDRIKTWFSVAIEGGEIEQQLKEEMLP